MRGRKISESTIAGAICLMLLAVMDIILIFRVYVLDIVVGIPSFIIIQCIEAIGVIVIAI